MDDKDTIVIDEVTPKVEKPSGEKPTGKDKKPIGLIVVVAILSVTLIGVIIYLVLDKTVLSKDKEEPKTSENVEKEESTETPGENKNEDKETGMTTPDYPPTLNPDNEYTLTESHQSNFDEYLKKTGDKTYEVHLPSTWIDAYETKNLDLAFSVDGDVKFVKIHGFGQAVGGEQIFVVYNDGTVSHQKLSEALKEQKVTLSKFNKVTNVTDLHGANVMSKTYGWGWYTTLAMRKDGTYYDLADYINTKI